MNQSVFIFFLSLSLFGICTLSFTSASLAQVKNENKSNAKKKADSKKNKTSSTSKKKASTQNKSNPEKKVEQNESQDVQVGAEKIDESVIADEIADVDVPLKDESAPVVQSPPPDQTPLVSNVQPQMVKMSKDKKFKINFEDELISGAQDKPELETIFSRKRMNFKKMIRLRENFIDESEKGKEFFREGI
jgi:flagellum-specific peptidoglycan hydrolase FlgJ